MSQRTQDDFPKMGTMKKSGSPVASKANSGEPRGLFPKNLPSHSKGAKPSGTPAKVAKDPKISGRVK